MYKSEEIKLKSLVEPEVWELLKANNAIIAGGAVTSLFTSQEINDIDVYLPSQRAVVNILADAFGQQDFTETCDYVYAFQLMFINIAEKSIMLKNKEQDIQLITFKYFDSAEEIFATFDFTVCMGAYDMQKEEFVFHPEFMKHNSQRYLKFNKGTAFPLVSALRVDKYKNKGYEISKAEFLRVIFCCMEMDITSWEELKSHIGGMYGYNMDEFFDETKEFSISEAMEQMGEKTYLHKPFPVVEKDFVTVLTEFDSADEVELPDPPYRAGYYYKHVGVDLKTNHYHQNKIDYAIGSIVNGGGQGIFIHANPLKPWTNEGVCIELEPVGDFEIRKGDGWDERKARAFGDFKVTRVVPKWDENYSKPEIKYLVNREISENNEKI